MINIKLPTNLYGYSSMDRINISEVLDPGSIPGSRTII